MTFDKWLDLRDDLDGCVVDYMSAYDCGHSEGAQSRQAEVDELKKQLGLVLDAYYLTGYFESIVCINAENLLGDNNRLSDTWYLKNVKGENQ